MPTSSADYQTQRDDRPDGDGNKVVALHEHLIVSSTSTVIRWLRITAYFRMAFVIRRALMRDPLLLLTDV